jgi:hypothetical protein
VSLAPRLAATYRRIWDTYRGWTPSILLLALIVPIDRREGAAPPVHPTPSPA